LEPTKDERNVEMASTSKAGGEGEDQNPGSVAGATDEDRSSRGETDPGVQNRGALSHKLDLQFGHLSILSHQGHLHGPPGVDLNYRGTVSHEVEIHILEKAIARKVEEGA
jgi:hypothetical protein